MYDALMLALARACHNSAAHYAATRRICIMEYIIEAVFFVYVLLLVLECIAPHQTCTNDVWGKGL